MAVKQGLKGFVSVDDRMARASRMNPYRHQRQGGLRDDTEVHINYTRAQLSDLLQRIQRKHGAKY